MTTPPPRPPAGPLAVLVTNADRSGTTYSILLVDLQGRVVERVDAALPHVKPAESLHLPLVSASNDRVYFRDGDTTVRAMAPDGSVSTPFSIADGASAEIGFAVSPDDSKVAVATITENNNVAQDTGRGFVQTLSGAKRAQLWSNTGLDALRWPVGWSGGGIVDAIANGTAGYGSAVVPAQSYHVIDATTGARTASVCSTDYSQPSAPYYNVEGGPTAAGVACLESHGDCVSAPGESLTLMAVDWSGREHTFLHKTMRQGTTCGQTVLVPYYQCFLSPAGTEMACSTVQSQALTIIDASGNTSSTGRRYGVMGWMDETHLMAGVDASTLAVIDVTTGASTPLPMQAADHIDFGGALPSGF